MKISVVIPVYNEISTIETILEKVKSSPAFKDNEMEIIMVDDCSNDGSTDLLKSLASSEIKVFHHEKNQGKGKALQTGFSKCTGEIVIIQDADLEYDPDEYPKLLKPITENKADVVYGSRFAGGETHRILYFWHTLANKFLTLLSNMFSDLNLTDMETCYKVFRREIIQKITLEEKRFGVEPEITAKLGEMLRKENIRIYEVGISYNGRTYDEGKKIGMKDAFEAFWCIFKYNTSSFAHLVKYAFNGILVALSQIISLLILVKYANLTTLIEKNIAHAISVEISIVVGFLLHSFITWRYKYKSGGEVLKKALFFQGVTTLSFLTRQVAFYLLTKFTDIHYILATLIGIVIAIILNFLGYEKIVFKNRK